MNSNITYSALIVSISGILSFGNIGFASQGGMPGYESFPDYRSMPEYQSSNPERSNVLPLHLQAIAQIAAHLNSGQMQQADLQKLSEDRRQDVLNYMAENFPAYMAKNFPSYQSMPEEHHDKKGEGEGSSGQSSMREVD